MRNPQFRILGSVLLLALSLVLPRTALGQENDAAAEVADSFRKAVVSEWGWKPNNGVALTTTEFARDYLTRSKFMWHQQPLNSILSSSRLVLFQTDTVDIFVSVTDMPAVAIVQRSTGEILAECLRSGVVRRCNAQFVDVDRAAPFELLLDTSTSGGTGVYHTSYSIFDLSSDFEPMLQLEGEYIGFQRECPVVQTVARTPQQKRPWGLDDNGTVTLPFKTLLMRCSPKSGLEPAESEVHLNRTCRFDSKNRRFSCETNYIRRATISLAMLKTGDWQNNARNIRWVLKNADKLRANGFRFPDGFLERLPRHLPESSDD